MELLLAACRSYPLSASYCGELVPPVSGILNIHLQKILPIPEPLVALFLQANINEFCRRNKYFFLLVKGYGLFGR